MPARILAVDLKEDNFAQVIVADDQLSLAIGKGGQNARLAAKLTNWRIDIKSESQFREMLEQQTNAGENTEIVNDDYESEKVNEEPIETGEE